MIEKTILSNGKNQFENNVFDSREWSAPIIVSSNEIENRLQSMNLVGRTIKDVRIMGLSYLHVEDWLEESMYNSLPEEMPDEERQLKSEYKNISDELILARLTRIDEPFLIKFADGDIFEIDTPQTPEYRFSMNCIPWDIKTNTRINNVDARILFAPFLNRRIVEVEVTKKHTDTDPMFLRKFDDEGTTHEIVIRIVLWLDNDIGICISGWFDYCDIACIDRNNELLPITFGELKPGLKN